MGSKMDADADIGRIVETLSNPFGIATLFGLEAEATCSVVPLARSLVGNRSAVVIKTPEGDVQERRIPAGRLTFHGTNTLDVDVDLGAAEIMDVASGFATSPTSRASPAPISAA